MISAADARLLQGTSTEDMLKELELSITSSAMLGKGFVIIRSEPYADWMAPGRILSAPEQEVLAELTRLGYTVSLYIKRVDQEVRTPGDIMKLYMTYPDEVALKISWAA